ncbi:MAG TPA: ester cyclase [Candidatus Angelobacter sp.]|jgi:steroid delta-isomerase-like uncharacterized protein|nr:ester cyclase [Candidatus Angelobacter sp.]
MRKATLQIAIVLTCLAAMAQQPSQLEVNKTVARDFFQQVLDQGHLDKYADSHASDFVAHAADHDASLAEDMAAAAEERKALPDMRVKVNHMVAERDLVSVFWTASGTNTHEGMGFPATGKPIRVNGMTLFRFQAGKIVEEWSVFDMLSAMRQAGLLATPSKQ